MIKSKKQMLLVIGAFVLTLLLGTATYAFFNYTRTGSGNNIRTGRIYFNADQGNNRVTLTDLFPISLGENETVTAQTPGVGSLKLHITGDTTYTEGVEYLIEAVDVTGNGETALPISINISYAATAVEQGQDANVIGIEDEDYFTNRGGETSRYKLLSEGSISEGEDILVGYIAPGASGIDGELTILAYLDARNIAITDTYPEQTVRVVANYDSSACESALTGLASASTICASAEALQTELDSGNTLTTLQKTALLNAGVITEYTDGTTSDWVNGRTVFTTSEWNSLQATGVSFKIKATANEGTWVNEVRTVNTMNTFPTVITDQSANIKEVYFNKMGATRMQNAYNAATIKADLTYNNEGKVLAWLETNEDDNTKYNLIVASDGDTYLTTGNTLFLGWLNTEKIMFNNVNTNNVTDMDAMFNGCSSLVSINLSGQGGNNLTSMNGIFIGCDAMQEINMSRFNFGSATINFQGANNVETIILSDANTSRVTNMSNMFSGMSNLESVDLSGIDTSNVTNLNGMFQMCSKLTQLDLSSFETSSINNSGGAYNMFYGCSSLNKIYVSNSWDLSNQPSGMPIFGSNTNLVGYASNTTYSFDSSKVDKEMAVIATDSTQGYLTLKTN